MAERFIEVNRRLHRTIIAFSIRIGNRIAPAIRKSRFCVTEKRFERFYCLMELETSTTSWIGNAL